MGNGKVMGAMDAFVSEQVLRFAATSADATEAKPLVLGNVEFWIGEGAWKGTLTYSIPSYAWDKETVQAALNAYLADKMDALKAYLHLA